MSVFASRNSNIVDAAASVVLRDAEAGGEVASGYTGENSIQVRRATPRWSEQQPLEDSFDITFTVRTIDTSGDAVYTLSVSSQDAPFSARTELASLNVVAAGQYVVSIDANQLSDAASFITCGVTISGTNRFIDYAASLRPSGVKVRPSRAKARDTSNVNSKGMLRR